ncbi:hypothetical protein DB459_13655 [Bradyrhizobium sp. WD16]|nr:hypothetical protein DB459_13655 [Bradyrhizobium sp. WD16]
MSLPLPFIADKTELDVQQPQCAVNDLIDALELSRNRVDVLALRAESQSLATMLASQAVRFLKTWLGGING